MTLNYRLIPPGKAVVSHTSELASFLSTSNSLYVGAQVLRQTPEWLPWDRGVAQKDPASRTAPCPCINQHLLHFAALDEVLVHDFCYFYPCHRIGKGYWQTGRLFKLTFRMKKHGSNGVQCIKDK